MRISVRSPMRQRSHVTPLYFSRTAPAAKTPPKEAALSLGGPTVAVQDWLRCGLFSGPQMWRRGNSLLEVEACHRAGVSRLFTAVDRRCRNLRLLLFRPQCALVNRRLDPPHPALWAFRADRRVSGGPCQEFPPGAQNRLTLGQILLPRKPTPRLTPRISLG